LRNSSLGSSKVGSANAFPMWLLSELLAVELAGGLVRGSSTVSEDIRDFNVSRTRSSVPRKNVCPLSFEDRPASLNQELCFLRRAIARSRTLTKEGNSDRWFLEGDDVFGEGDKVFDSDCVCYWSCRSGIGRFVLSGQRINRRRSLAILLLLLFLLWYLLTTCFSSYITQQIERIAASSSSRC
jgi:hypothetical protein